MPNPTVRLRTFKTWELIDGTKERAGMEDSHHIAVPPGEYEVEVVKNPRPGYSNPWFVLKGTLTGMSCGGWFQWCNGAINAFGSPIDWGTWEIQVFIDGVKVAPTVERLDQTGHAWEF